VSPEPASSLPPWRRWWAYCAYAAGAVLFGYLAHHFRVRGVVQFERLRARISSDLHDELGVRLTAITLRSEAALRQEAIPPDVKEALEWTATTARETIDSMRDVVWALNPQRDYLDDLVQRIRLFAASLDAPPQVECDLDGRTRLPLLQRLRFFAATLDTPPQVEYELGGRRIPLPMELRRNGHLVVKEAIHNAIAHSGARHVRIQVHVEGTDLVMAVSDDGIGFDPALLKAAGLAGNGLTSMSKRAQEVGGELLLDSGVGRGTAVVFRAPLRRSLWPNLRLWSLHGQHK
jgi:signal transduction histidine kinase